MDVYKYAFLLSVSNVNLCQKIGLAAQEEGKIIFNLPVYQVLTDLVL